MHIFNSYKKITFDYLNNAVNTIEQILNNDFIIDNNSNNITAIADFKEYLTEFVYNYKTYSNYMEFFNMTHSYLTATSKYVQLSKQEPKYANKLFVKLLKKYKVEQFNMEYEKILEKFVQEMYDYYFNNLYDGEENYLFDQFNEVDRMTNYVDKVNELNLIVFKNEDRYIRIMRQQYTQI